MRVTKKAQREYHATCGEKYRDRLSGLGKEQGEVCFGCRTIYECGGVMGINICPTLDHMAEQGMIKITHKQPKWMNWASRMKS